MARGVGDALRFSFYICIAICICELLLNRRMDCTVVYWIFIAVFIFVAFYVFISNSFNIGYSYFLTHLNTPVPSGISHNENPNS